MSNIRARRTPNAIKKVDRQHRRLFRFYYRYFSLLALALASSYELMTPLEPRRDAL